MTRQSVVSTHRAMSMPRFWIGFALLVACLFGPLGFGCYWIATNRPGLALVAVAVAFANGKILPRRVGWLVMLGRQSR